MKKVFIAMAMFGLLVGVTVANSMAHGMQKTRQAGDGSRPEATEQGYLGQSMMHSQSMGWLMMGPYVLDGSMSGMMDRMDTGPMGLFMMEQQPERDFYLDRVKELNLSPDQVSRLKTLRLECRKDNLRSASEATIARLELANLLNGDRWSLKNAEALVRRIQEKETDIQVRHLKAAIDARNVLTPKQLAQVKADDDLYEPFAHFG